MSCDYKIHLFTNSFHQQSVASKRTRHYSLGFFCVCEGWSVYMFRWHAVQVPRYGEDAALTVSIGTYIASYLVSSLVCQRSIARDSLPF